MCPTATNIGKPSLILSTPNKIWIPKNKINNNDNTFWNGDLIIKNENTDNKIIAAVAKIAHILCVKCIATLAGLSNLPNS